MNSMSSSRGYMSILASPTIQSQMLHDHVVGHFSFQYVVDVTLYSFVIHVQMLSTNVAVSTT